MFRVFVPAFLFLQPGSGSDDRSRIARCVEGELRIHPESHLVDLYKYFFQDVFGPGHMVSDRASAAKYLDEELSSAGSFETADYEELMYRGQFVRVNLRMVADSVISKQVLLDAFMQSAQEFKLPDVDQWRGEWAEIARVIREVKPLLPGYDQESLQIDSLLQSGNYAVHHSRDYVRAYDPHYRIIHRKYFKKLILNRNSS